MRQWINSTGKDILDLQKHMPRNLVEALKMRKQHEKLELTFLLWNLLDDVENATKAFRLLDSKSVLSAIAWLDRGMTSSSAKIALLSHELQRLQLILDSEDNEHFYQLMNGFREICQLTANAQQIMNLRKLVLFKERRETFNECQHLFDVYRRMCAVDNRHLSRQILSTKTRLLKDYASFSTKIGEIIKLTSYSESFYVAADSLLETVGNALLKVSSKLIPDNATTALAALNNDFQKLRKLAAEILDNIDFVSELLVILLMMLSVNQSPMVSQQRVKVVRALSQIEIPLSQVPHYSQSLLSLPSKLTKSSSNPLSSDNGYGKSVDDFVHHLNGLAQAYIVPLNPCTIDDADKALQSIETAKSLADMEWRKLDDRDAAAQHYDIWSSQLKEKWENVLRRKHLLLRISELERDLNVCCRKLDQLIDAAYCSGGDSLSGEYLKKLEVISSDVMCLRNTVPNSQLLVAAREFTSSLQSKFNGISQDSESLRKIQQEAARLQENIEHHLSTITNPLDPVFQKPSVYWLVEGLQSTLGTLQEVGEEAEIMATNLSDHVSRMDPSGSPNPDCSQSPHRNSPYDGKEEYDTTNSHQSSRKSRINASGFEDDASPIEGDKEMYFSKPSDVMNATPGGSITIHCTFHGFEEEPNIKWSFVPAHRASEGAEFAESFLVSTTIPHNDAKTASLLIPNVLYKHAGQYIVTITNSLTGKQISSSSKLHVKPKLKRGLTDLSAIVDGNKCTVTGKEVVFFLEYGGFDRLPSRVVWMHNGKPIDPTKWAVSIGLSTARIRSDCLKSVDEGQYTCQVSDDELDVKLESSAALRLQNALDVPRPASRASSRTVTPSGNGKFSWVTKALDSSPLSLKCPLPSVASEAYGEARRVRMQWFRDGTQLYDSDWQTPDYFTNSQGVPFVDGNTYWSVSVCEGRTVLLNTNRIRSVDAGRYSCHYDRDAFPCDSGVITVCSSQQFVEQLTGLKVYLGEPAELRCRLEPWVAGNSPEFRTIIKWYHFETLLTSELQDRVGIKTECDEGLCTLRIEKTSRRFGGVYKCEATNKFGICIVTTKEESLLHLPNSQIEETSTYSVVIKNVAGSAESSYTLQLGGRPTKSANQNELRRSPRRSPVDTSPNVQSQNLDTGTSFLLRPQNISANVGESVVVSCVIRPSPGAPKIHRVSWRYKDYEFMQGQSETGRVISKANSPYNGVFQLHFTNICEGDYGNYKVLALDENGIEICSAVFNLSVNDRKGHSEKEEELPIRDEVFLDGPKLPPRATVGVGERLEMTCYITGYPTPQVFWFKDDQQLSDRNSSNDFQFKKRGNVYQLIIPCALPHHSGLWEVIARNSAGLVMSGSNIEVKASERRSASPSSLVPLDRRARSLPPCASTENPSNRMHLCLDRSYMNEQAPRFTKLFSDQTAFSGDTAQFECSVIGFPTPDFIDARKVCFINQASSQEESPPFGGGHVLRVKMLPFCASHRYKYLHTRTPPSGEVWVASNCHELSCTSVLDLNISNSVSLRKSDLLCATPKVKRF
ncbi:unnamed protein product [Hydatigera taeniaeformis]|uniref:Ig-like domain-containing protein n=1 Tax=Hydatigena taeniaeformis TaxID=6205 RepID=A0A0R3X1I9_HYDTA|nr:unnamed protein product [Hydatigera taeniaeformis]